jgi:hypothetical protein
VLSTVLKLTEVKRLLKQLGRHTGHLYVSTSSPPFVTYAAEYKIANRREVLVVSACLTPTSACCSPGLALLMVMVVKVWSEKKM